MDYRLTRLATQTGDELKKAFLAIPTNVTSLNLGGNGPWHQNRR